MQEVTRSVLRCFRRANHSPLFLLALISGIKGQSFCTVNCQETRNHNSMSSQLEQAKSDAFWGMFVADALAMPVHWYYNPADIKRGYGGWLSGYKAPNKKHPSSILTLSATDGSGRTGWHSKTKSVVGDIILHDKLKYWTSGDRSTHYHQGMSAGDNTLNAVTALHCAETMQTADPEATQPPRQLRAAVFENYVDFMTTPGSHNDTYAESWHRLFFREWRTEDPQPKSGEDIVRFSENRFAKTTSANEDGQIAAIGALVIAVPWVLHYCHLGEVECLQNTVDALVLSHPAPSLIPYVRLYAKILFAVVNGGDLKAEVEQALQGKVMGGPRKLKTIEGMSEEARKYPRGSEAQLEVYQRATYTLGSACYIDGALTTMLFLAREFHNDFEQGVLTNANCGGENAHRGAALGALLAANAVNLGEKLPAKWKENLNSLRPRLLKVTESRL